MDKDPTSKTPDPSLSRLFEAAAEHGDQTPGAVAKRLNTSAQTVNNWVHRGVSKDGAMAAQNAYGCDANWILGKPGAQKSGSAVPVSNRETSGVQAPQNQRRRVQVEGVVAMDDQGFWRRGDAETELWEVNTDDREAYGVRLLTQHFDPVVSPGQCLLVSPSRDVKLGRWVLVTLADGRQSFRMFRGHDYGVWHFAEVNRPTSYLDISDADVGRVERVMSVSWTD